MDWNCRECGKVSVHFPWGVNWTWRCSRTRNSKLSARHGMVWVSGCLRKFIVGLILWGWALSSWYQWYEVSGFGECSKELWRYCLCLDHYSGRPQVELSNQVQDPTSHGAWITPQITLNEKIVWIRFTVPSPYPATWVQNAETTFISGENVSPLPMTPLLTLCWSL